MVGETSQDNRSALCRDTFLDIINDLLISELVVTDDFISLVNMELIPTVRTDRARETRHNQMVNALLFSFFLCSIFKADRPKQHLIYSLKAIAAKRCGRYAINIFRGNFPQDSADGGGGAVMAFINEHHSVILQPWVKFPLFIQ